MAQPKNEVETFLSSRLRLDHSGEIEMDNLNPATEKQVSLLVKLGVQPEIASSYSRNQAIIEIQFRLEQPTVRQKVFLMRRGVLAENIEKLTKEEAGQWISQILYGC